MPSDFESDCGTVIDAQSLLTVIYNSFNLPNNRQTRQCTQKALQLVYSLCNTRELEQRLKAVHLRLDPVLRIQ